MESWWQSLNQKERYMIIAGGVFTLLILFYILIWNPFVKRIEMLDQQVKSQASTLVWMREASRRVQEHRAMPSGQKSSDRRSIAALVEATTKKLGIAESLHRIEPEDRHTLKVWFNSVQFNSFLQWLAELEHSYAATIENLSVTKEEFPGVVDTQLVLKRVR